jgi:hypothetical protein
MYANLSHLYNLGKVPEGCKLSRNKVQPQAFPPAASPRIQKKCVSSFSLVSCCSCILLRRLYSSPSPNNSPHPIMPNFAIASSSLHKSPAAIPLYPSKISCRLSKVFCWLSKIFCWLSKRFRWLWLIFYWISSSFCWLLYSQ